MIGRIKRDCFATLQHNVPVSLNVKIINQERNGKRRKGVIGSIGVRPELEGQRKGDVVDRAHL